MRNFYQVYDFEQERVGLGVHIFSEGTIEMETKHWVKTIVIVGLILIALILLFLYLRNRRRRFEQIKQKEY